jgi:hypothetical protein
MCDFSLQSVRSRSAAIGDKLVSHNFGTGTSGFIASAGPSDVAVCILPGTELAFAAGKVGLRAHGVLGRRTEYAHDTAIFRQINKDKAAAHHDALEFPDGRIVLLTLLEAGQEASVLQLPAAPKDDAERANQKRVEYAG